ncbi:hypothetical protein C8R43DRAFT_1138025 [Mycena crocata]|nr:hypothetical protein C8R43DRAFT_1138025 [Mycena crocata]
MSIPITSLVVHFIYLVAPATAHRLANATYPHRIPAFAAAVHTQSGTEHGAREAINRCHDPPARGISSRPPIDALWWEHAALDLAMWNALHSLFLMANGEFQELAVPRFKPAITRKRGEGSVKWLSPRHEAHLSGHEPPDMDWTTARAVTLSEFDRVFFDELLMPNLIRIGSISIKSTMCFVVASTLSHCDHISTSSQLAHMVWLHASELLEDLYNRGLATSSQIEREYEKDRKLMLRLIVCYTKMEALALHLWSNMTQVITASPNLVPCVIRRRTAAGKPDIQVNKSPAGQTAHSLLNPLETFTIDLLMRNTRLPDTLCDVRMKELALDHHAADRFDAGTFELIGEMAELMCPMKRPEALKQVNTPSDWGLPYSAMVAVHDTWRNVCWRLNMQGVQGPNGLLARIERRDYLDPASFDEMWATYDYVLLTHLLPRTQPGAGKLRALGCHFGLYTLDDPTGPTCEKVLQDQWIKRSLDGEGTTCGSSEDSGSGVEPAKEKVKTRTEVSTDPELLPVDGDPDEEKSEDIPESLPHKFKLGKKVLKVFHQILAEDDTVIGIKDNASALKKGQIRWDAFEKSFGLSEQSPTFGAECTGTFRDVLTGSIFVGRITERRLVSPTISPFRPTCKERVSNNLPPSAPAAILTPRLIKWVGARLKRNYGWTTSTFTQGANSD